ncbi:MAG: phosphoribosylaminoimidazolesuccinocarboxamide synthase [Helicobacteraceae bacterium]|jgi:phosphoribosylaminoimidazole-succinocarboxamide synthase|nr:phosphoribosylaminoimidazolesuccinocarboxamide synthase [Helicobacteraceae bacterium]
MNKKEQIYEGKGKKLFATDDAATLIAEFKDDLTAFNAQKKAQEKGKGALNAAISAKLFRLIELNGVSTHLIKRLDETNHLIKKTQIIPIEVVVRNIATGSLTKRLGIAEGVKLPFALVEFYYKNDNLGDPILNDEHAVLMKLASENELKTLKELARKINDILRPFFESIQLKLVDFKVEFGRDQSGRILLADEIGPDSCRFWDANSGEKLDKDRFRQDLGGVKAAYEEVLRRVEGALK